MSNTLSKTRKMTLTAILAAVSSVLMFFSINVPLMPSFIKLDLSELPAVFAAFALGPWSGVTVALVKNIVNLFFSTTGGVGEISNFLLSSSFVLTAGYIYKRNKTKTRAVVGGITGAIVMALFSILTNFYIVYPIYTNFMPLEAILGMYHIINPYVGTEATNENLLKALVVFNLPFTFIKGMLSVIITILIYKPLSPIIHGKTRL